MSEPIDFAKRYEFEVEVFDEELGALGPGTLRFGAERWTHIRCNQFAAIKALSEGGAGRILKARTAIGECFTLFNCKRMGSYVGADYVFTGDVAGTFKRIEIRYSDISEWYSRWQKLDGKVGGAISWKNPVKHIATTVKTARETFTLNTESEAAITQSGEDYILHEHVLFCLEHHNGYFSPKDMQTRVLELANLLSILVAYPVSTISVNVVCENSLTHGAFFPTFKRVERDASANDFPQLCFIQERSIHDRWEGIFNRYFNSTYRQGSWSRLAGMQRYEGFWEFRALGYVSLLDRYVDQRYREANRRETKTVPPGGAVKKELAGGLKAVDPHLTSKQRAAVMTIASRVFAQERDLNFGEKYRRAISESNQDIVRIVNISKEDVGLIKIVRDRVAHGAAPNLPDANLTRITIVISKIALLMTYWAFLDFGLTHDDFLRCLTTTHNPLRFSGQLDTTHIDRMTKPESFFAVSKEKFAELSAIDGIRNFPCFTQSASGAIEYSKEYSMAYRSWMTSDPGTSKRTSRADIFGVARERITYLSPAYIECDGECLRLSVALVIKDI